MQIDLVGESVKFMILGMTVVFVFLVVMVQLMKLQHALIAKYFPDPTPQSPAVPPAADTEEESRRVAAIVGALAQYRKNKSQPKG